MENCAKLEIFLEEHEIKNIPEIAKRKITEHLSGLNHLISELRNENSELTAVLERQQFEFEKEVAESQQQFQESAKSCATLKLQVAELEENLSSVQKQWKDLQTLHDSTVLEFQSSKRENELLNKEKRNLTDQLEKRRAEIDKLNGDLKNVLEQITAANEAKFEAIAVSEEAKLKESNLQHQVNRLEQEKELLNRQIADLNSELTEKNHEIHTLKREKSNNILDLQTRLENRSDEIHLLQKKLDSFKELNEEKDARIEALAEKIRSLNQSHAKAEEQFNLEINAQSKLIELHKKASEDNQQRVQSLMRAFEEAQKLLKESAESCDEMERHCKQLEEKSKIKIEEKQAEIQMLREELRKAKDSVHGFNQDTIEKIFPVAAATSKVLHSGMTLTELYVEYTRLQEELQLQKSENSKLTQELKQIVTEIEEKTPVINQRMMDYEKSKDTISCLKSQLANALADYEKLLDERNDAKRICGLSERENARLKSQVLDLNRQVQVLLKEVEEARGGCIRNNKSRKEEEEVTSSDDITADKIISRHLVTFRDIEEIQLKNQQLLTAIRDLSQQHEEMEKKVSMEVNAKFEKDIASLSSQLDDLQKKRSKQNEMLETIIRQRDMYRVLLTSQGFSESLLGQPEGSLSLLQSSGTYSPGDSRLKEHESAMNQLQKEFNNYKKEKNENERMLNEQVDKMRNDISELRIQNAKLASQCEYSEERVKILQSNLKTYKKEYTSFKDKNRQHSSMIIQHQQTINSLRQDLMVAQEKLAKSEVTIENLRAERDLLKNVEARLLQEKESVMREQQHQSRMMANLQAVQNNLERMESETKRNLEYQVEKYEKENSILKTKVENANEEFRSAVKVWEKQNKDLQGKIDIEVEKNQKLHEDLVDAYSQVHALNQNLINVKAQLAAAPEKTTTDASPKTPVKSSASSQGVTEVKVLKEQLNEVQLKLKAVQEKLDLTNKSAEQYLSMCRDLELRVKEQDEINKQLKESMDNALNSSSEVRSSLEKSLENMEKANRELIEENMKLSQDSGSQVNELQKKVSELQNAIENYKNQAEVSKKTADQAREDCQNQVKLMQEVQEKYERELMQHAQDIKSMTVLKEEHQNCSLKFERLTEACRVTEEMLADSKGSWLRQEEILKNEVDAHKKKIFDLESCNSSLHEQLELMGTQMAALQSKNWDETPYSTLQSDLKDTQHLLQVIQFIRKEKEIASTQYDLAQSENIRLNLKVEQLTNELNESKAELTDLMNDAQAKAASDVQHTQLLKKIEMVNLLTESNNMLRMEKDALAEAKTKLENQLHELEEKFQPLSEKEKEMNQQIDMLTAENGALRIEVKSWQSRTNQLLEQSHRIGPQEYKNLMREIEELKSQKTRLAEELQKKQAEVSQINANMASLRKELENSKNEVKEKVQEVVKMTEDNAEHQKTLLQIKKIGRKYKTQFDELKVNYDALLAKSKAVDTSNQEQIVQEMQKKVEDSDKKMKELKEEADKQKENAVQAKKMAESIQSKANEKEEKAKKLMGQFGQKYTQLKGQKDSLLEDNKKLTKELEELKGQIASFMASQEENLQNKLQSENKIARLEKELRMAKEYMKRNYLQKHYDDIGQKAVPHKPNTKSSMGERGSGAAEPLTANIKPLTPLPSTSATGSNLRHSAHPHAAATVTRPTPTASIRPMAIGTASAATPTQTRMATVLPTTATPPHSEEENVPMITPTPVSVPHAAVQPTPATATVAPTTMAVTVSPVTSDVSDTDILGNVIESNEELGPPTLPAVTREMHSVTAVVSPRIDVSEVSTESLTSDSPAPTTSVIVSPPATQTQIVAPTVKRAREDSPGSSETQENAVKRVRMISEGSQTNQQLSGITPPSNVAVVSAAQVVSRSKSQPSPVTETVLPSNTEPEAKDMPVSIPSSPQPSSSDVDEPAVPPPEAVEAEILEDDEKEEQNIDWEPQDDAKIDDEYEAEVMEEEVPADDVEELEEDVEQMQGIDARSPDDEDMTEEQQDDVEEMAEQPNPPSSDIDILDSSSDVQMDADSSSLQAAPSDQCMAPPAFPPTLDVQLVTEPPPTAESSLVSNTSTSTLTVPLPGPPRLERQPPVSRQHLTPFTIPGQGSNFEDGDDSIVPSTPTLYVPRRSDGFAEAVSSPQVPHVPRFLFSSADNSPVQQSFSHSQLASQGALGVDDTRMDLFDEGVRTVPSTPLQVSPPADAIVPELSESSIETDSVIATSNMIIPIIKVDLAEPVEGEQITSKIIEGSDVEGNSSTTKDDLKPEDEEKKTELQSSESSTEPRVEEVSPNEGQTSSETAKTDETAESDQQTKDAALSQASQRKPIVWSQESNAQASPAIPETVTSTSPSTSTAGLLPTPTTRGRPRARRVRFPGASSYRGRGTENTWSGSGRRGRSAARRRAMY